jgi:hypothetical protein
MKGFKRWKSNRKTLFHFKIINLENHDGTAGENTDGKGMHFRIRIEIEILNTALNNKVNPFGDTVHAVNGKFISIVKKIKNESVNGKCRI